MDRASNVQLDAYHRPHVEEVPHVHANDSHSRNQAGGGQ